MTSLQIAYFLKAAECMSFSRAAQELYVSQPSVSRQIKLLEAELGYTLFDRSRKNSIHLTAAGMVFRETFLRASLQFHAAKSAAQEISMEPGLQLRVGVGEYWDMSGELTSFRQAVFQRNPGAALQFETNSFQQLRSRLRSGDLDVILCTKTSLTDFDGLEVAELAELESRAYVRRGLLCPAETPLSAEDFDGAKLLMLSEEESPMAMELAQLQFLARQVKVTPVWLPNRDTILQALLMGDGAAVFDPYVRFRDDPRLTYFDLQDRIPICALWKKSSQNPLVPMFLQHMGEAISGKARQADPVRFPAGDSR